MQTILQTLDRMGYENYTDIDIGYIYFLKEECEQGALGPPPEQIEPIAPCCRFGRKTVTRELVEQYKLFSLTLFPCRQHIICYNRPVGTIIGWGRGRVAGLDYLPPMQNMAMSLTAWGEEISKGIFLGR